jgi:hypothetical protein
MKIAMYKGTKRFFNRAVSWWTEGIYSHCEIVFSDGMAASSSQMDGGVRTKYIEFDPMVWDFIDIGGSPEYEAKVRQWFKDHEEERYDYLGLVGFVFRPVKGKGSRKFCSEACLEALGYDDPWRFEPNIIPALFKNPVW